MTRERRWLEEGELKKERLIQLLHESSAASPKSGLLSNWSKNKKILVNGLNPGVMS